MNESESVIDRIRFYREKLENAPGTWPAKRELADAVRELMDCLSATDAPAEDLLAIAAHVRESVEGFTGQPHMENPPGVAEGSLAAGMEMFMDRSPIVGLANPIAPPVRLDPDHETKIVHGEVTFGRAYEGAPGCAHGGFVSAVFDEALGLACVFSGTPGMTGELTVRYLKPTPIRVPLRIEARMDRREGRKIFNSGELHAGDTLIARSHGIFISVPHEKFAELRAAQAEREHDRNERG